MSSRQLLATLAILALFGGAAVGAAKKKKKNKADEEPPTQVLELPKDPPSAVSGDIARLSFNVTPLSGKGLLSQQMRDSLKEMLRFTNTPLKIRAFVAGSADLRRVPGIISETLTDKHIPLPAVTVVQAGALPLAGAQVVLEVISTAKKPVNPNGLVFLAGQQEVLRQPLAPVAPLVARSIERLKAAAAAAGSTPAGMLQVTCQTTSLDDVEAAKAGIRAAFPGAAINYVQLMRAASETIAACEGVARLAAAPARPVQGFSLSGSDGVDAIAVRGGQIALGGVQLGFGTTAADIRLALDRVDHSLESVHASRAGAFVVNFYTMSNAAAARLVQQRGEYFDKTNPIIYNLFFSEGLGSIDASFGVEVNSPVHQPLVRD